MIPPSLRDELRVPADKQRTQYAIALALSLVSDNDGLADFAARQRSDSAFAYTLNTVFNALLDFGVLVETDGLFHWHPNPYGALLRAHNEI